MQLIAIAWHLFRSASRSGWPDTHSTLKGAAGPTMQLHSIPRVRVRLSRPHICVFNMVACYVLIPYTSAGCLCVSLGLVEVFPVSELGLSPVRATKVPIVTVEQQTES